MVHGLSSHRRSLVLAVFLGFSLLGAAVSCDGGSGSAVSLEPFLDRTVDAGLMDVDGLGRTASWADYDNDGWLDLFVGNTDMLAPNVYLFHNEADGTFTDVTLLSGIEDESIQSSAWADYDNDGLVDLVVGDILAGAPPVLYRNVDGATFVDVSAAAGLTLMGGAVSHVIWADYDRDGFVDLLQVNAGTSFLYHNLGDGTFTEVSESAGLGEFLVSNAAVWFDYDNDRFPDLFLANDGSNTLYHNNGDGTFTDVTAAAGVGGDEGWDSVSACVGDYDGDGFLDLYVGNIGASRNALYRNLGDGTFTDVTDQTGTGDVGDARTCAWVDFDADGRVDLFTTNHLNPSRLYRNLGGGLFDDVAPDVMLDFPLDVFAASWGDYNGDGFPDVMLHGHLGSALFENPSNANNFLYLVLVGDAPASNRSAIGARVEVRSPGGLQVREVSGGKGCCSQDMLPVHFGLGADTVADVVVRWPSGADCTFSAVDVTGGVFYKVSEAGCTLDPL